MSKTYVTVPINADEIIQFAQQIIRRASVYGAEGELGQYLYRALQDFGLQAELQEVAAARYNVLATLPGARPDIALLFHAHMDTVPCGAMPDPLSAAITDGHIWGRGSVDQKGGLAAAVMALAAIARVGVQLDYTLGLALVIDEESEHRGSMALVERGIQARQAVVTEPSGQRLVIGCKGTTPFQIRVKGKAAHGCRPWLGVNAVHQALRVASALEELEYSEHDVAGYGAVKGSLNLGVIEGGRAYNIVPDECAMWFDRRTVPGETQEDVLGAVQTILDRLAVGDNPVRSELRVARPDWHWAPIKERGLRPAVTPPAAPISALAARCHEAIMGAPPEIYYTDGYTEMDFLINDLGIPTVQYGPGDSSLCHTDEEQLNIAQLVNATRVYALMALNVKRDRR